MEITNCRACDSIKLTEFLDLGEQYLSDFRKDDKKPPKYPLLAVFCEDCKLVQLKHTVPQYEMYHDRYGFKSGISDSIKNDLRDVVLHAQDFKTEPKSWLDIASNDGTLLSFVPKDIFKVGVDPITFLCKEATQYADRIVNDYFDSYWFLGYNAFDGQAEYQTFDIITSISCFYDMPNPNKFVIDVKNVLSNEGVWIIQQNYLLTTMQLSAVDNFCHEHIEYYTLLSLENLLEKHGLEVNDVVLSTINGGSIRTVVSRRGTFPVESSVRIQRQRELDENLGNIQSYKAFARKAELQLLKLRTIIETIKLEGKTIYILAASTRGATIWQSAKIDAKQISYAVERNPGKVGSMFSAIGVPIISEEEARANKPDYMLVGIWFQIDEVIDREQDYLNAGGHLIVPLPEVEVI